MKSQRAPDGAQVEFVCKVEGYPRPQITWFRQTAIIKPSPDFQIYYDDNNMATLVIKEVFPAYMSLDSFLESSIYNLKLN